MDFKWYYGPGLDPEAYHGPCETREDAIAAAKAEWGDDEVFTIVEADKGDLDFGLFDFDDVIQKLKEVNEERWGEDGMDEVKPTQQQKGELEEVLEGAVREWFTKHKLAPKAWAFNVTRNEETFNDDL